MDAIGTVEVETSGVLHFGASPFCNSSFSVRDTVALSMPSTRPTSRALLPSLCSSIIAASRFSVSCTERAGGDLGGHIFPDWDFVTPSRRTSGYWRICYATIFATHQDRPRGLLKHMAWFRTTSRHTSGVAKREFVFWLPLQTDLGGGAFSGFPILSPLQTNLGAVLKAVGAFRTTSRRTSGVAKSRRGVSLPPPDRPRGTVLGFSHFCTPPDPLPDFPVHRGHRISTYRLLIDNSLSFPCLDGQC